MEVRGQPACPEVKMKYKKKYCVVMLFDVYMSVVHEMSHTHIVYLYSTIVLSCLVVKGGCTCEI
jgi:hypothetical protein